MKLFGLNEFVQLWISFNYRSIKRNFIIYEGIKLEDILFIEKILKSQQHDYISRNF